jgi:hypothetical protein
MSAVGRRTSLGLAIATTAAICGLEPVARAGQMPTPSRFDRIQYQGGAAGFRGTSNRWDNTLTISPARIEMNDRKGARIFEIDPARITNVEYRQYNRPAILFPGMSPPVDHFITIEYVLDDCQRAALLLRAHKDNYKEVMAALSLTHKAAYSENPQALPATCRQRLVPDADVIRSTR